MSFLEQLLESLILTVNLDEWGDFPPSTINGSLNVKRETYFILFY